MYSFGLALFVDLDMINLHGWKPVWCLGKSMGESFGKAKVILHMIKMKNFSIWRRFQDPEDLSGTQNRALARKEFHIWLEELASESNTIPVSYTHLTLPTT